LRYNASAGQTFKKISFIQNLMFYHVITSIGCNLSCKYCDKEEFGKFDEEAYDYKIL